MMNTYVAPPRAYIPTYKPGREDERYIRDGLAFLTMTAPFWSHILYSEMAIVYSHDIPYAATDAHYIFVNPDGMREAEMGIEEVAFVLAHEVCHYMFGDLLLGMVWRDQGHVMVSGGKTLPYSHDIMGAAMDFRINAALIQGKVGKFPKIGLYDKSLSEKGMEGAVEIYEKLWKAAGGGGGGKGAGTGKGGFDEHVEPGQEEQRAERGNGPAKRTQAIAAAVQAAQAAGKGNLPDAIKNVIGEILNPKVRWQDHLRASMQRAQGEPRHDWSKVNKRLISRPSHKIVFARKGNYGCGTLVVGYDTSGSVNNPEMMQRFFSEMNGIVQELAPKELIVMFCDTEVHRMDQLDEVEDLLAYREAVNDSGGTGGGGGTSFVPVFEEIKRLHLEPDMVVYLTDMLGTFPGEEPSYPVIWASILKREAPFGHVVHVEL